MYQIRSSLSSAVELKNLDTTHPLLHIVHHKERKTQFEHLQYIDENFPGDEKEFIMFMDDDDVLTRLPDAITTRRSVQYIGNMLSSKGLYTTFEPYKLEDGILFDFSGTITTRKKFRDFITNHHESKPGILPDVFLWQP